MRMTYQGLRGVIYLLAMLAVLVFGITSAQLALALHATASHAMPHAQFVNSCLAGDGHC